jgi:hypothetical protein
MSKPRCLLVYPTLITETPMTLGMLSAVMKEEGSLKTKKK